MSRRLWRIATDAPAYRADDLTGKGAEVTGGRWNAKGFAVVYASQTRALACLETLVHLNAGGLPLNRYLVAIDVPDDLWAKAERLSSEALSAGSDAQPAGKASIELGTAWLKGRGTSLLVAPSTIVPEEFNVLINPAHPDSGAIVAAKVRRWTYDPRLLTSESARSP